MTIKLDILHVLVLWYHREISGLPVGEGRNSVQESIVYSVRVGYQRSPIKLTIAIFHQNALKTHTAAHFFLPKVTVTQCLFNSISFIALMWSAFPTPHASWKYGLANAGSLEAMKYYIGMKWQNWKSLGSSTCIIVCLEWQADNGCWKSGAHAHIPCIRNDKGNIA